MKIFKKLFSKQERTIQTNEDFWIWFENNQISFFDTVKSNKNIDSKFFNPLSKKLNQLKDGCFFLTGMLNNKTAELVLTADGDIINIAFVEDIVKAAPTIKGWQFTALKQPSKIEDVCINMGGYDFDGDTLFFYANEVDKYPDEIDIVVAHKSYKKSDETTITNGTYLFLDNFIGELDFLMTIDNLKVISIQDAKKDLIPISQLKKYLNLREGKLKEKFQNSIRDTENDVYSSFTAKRKDGKELISIINTSILEWSDKASHPWILKIDIPYDGDNKKGMPNNDTYESMNDIEDNLVLELKDVDGYINIGRETGNNLRRIFFACHEFRKPSKIMHNFANKKDRKMTVKFNIYKDKYWQTFDKYLSN